MKRCLQLLSLCLLTIPMMALAQSGNEGVTGTVPTFDTTGLPSISTNPLDNPATSNSNNGTSTPNLNQQLNQQVLESQNNNEKYYQQALQNPSVPAGSVIQPSANGAMTATPDGPEQGTQLNLTDAEKKLSEEYIHDGRNLRLQEEACAKLDDPSACRGSEPDSKFMGMDASMVKVLSQMYTMVMGSAGGKLYAESSIKSKTPDADSANKPVETADKPDKPDEAADTEKKEDQEDYCKYGAMLVEGVAFFQQGMSNKNAAIPAGQETAQKEILYKAARAHKERAKTHKLQFVGWGATTACYVAMMTFTSASPTNWKNLAKLAASGIMTAFFKKQADLNEGYYESVKGIADKLPGKGDCNPITEKDCYCSQEETLNDQQVCLPYLHNNKVALGNYRIACTDNNGKVDPQCSCLAGNSCFDQKIMGKIKPFGFGSAFNSAASRPLSNLARGQLTANDLASADNGALNAYNRKGLDRLAKGAPSPGNLSKDDQKTIKDLNSLGLPPKLAALAAKQKLSANARANMSKFRGGSFGGRSLRYRAASRKRGSVLNFSGGGGANKRSRSKASTNQFSKFMNKKKGGSKRGQVLNYQDKALQSAQINKDKDRPIFEIISRRYQVSGFKRLEINR